MPVHPTEVLEDFLEPYNELVKNRTYIDLALATELEQLTGIKAETWLHIQTRYNLKTKEN